MSDKSSPQVISTKIGYSYVVVVNRVKKYVSYNSFEGSIFLTEYVNKKYIFETRELCLLAMDRIIHLIRVDLSPRDIINCYCESA